VSFHVRTQVVTPTFSIGSFLYNQFLSSIGRGFTQRDLSIFSPGMDLVVCVYQFSDDLFDNSLQIQFASWGHINPLPALTYQNVLDLNVACRAKCTQTYWHVRKFKCPLKKKQPSCPCSRDLNWTGKGLKMPKSSYCKLNKFPSVPALFDKLHSDRVYDTDTVLWSQLYCLLFLYFKSLSIFYWTCLNGIHISLEYRGILPNTKVSLFLVPHLHTPAPIPSSALEPSLHQTSPPLMSKYNLCFNPIVS
jgi:hypothetical protein